MQHYLTDIADILRAADVKVIEYPGWQKRGRSSNSGYEKGRPWCVMWHHTASTGFNPSGDCDYMCLYSPVKPIANLYVARDGTVWVLAAGPTNTNGSGKALGMTKGIVPANDMNRHAIGMEIANEGTGQGYPGVQIDAAFKASLALCAAYGLAPDDVSTHSEYAPSRKIDPATDNVGGTWVPFVSGAARSWLAGSLREECRRRARLIAARRLTELAPAVRIEQSQKVEQMATAIIRVSGRNAQFIGTGTLMPDGNVHCVCVSWYGPGPVENPFLADHAGASDIVHQTYTPETVQRDLVLVGVYAGDIDDSLHHWTKDDFAHAMERP